ncbi:MFS transporter [Actinocrinis puniceicyclus]|uniref:MFS transporter n=1 Tax=Actinocrinis puniceicyclus TaxID=977794 RepID=A0A8J8BCP0_9ACTN|nr:MFS transporter [Actinocrinis puniceicyclus]MBS2964388.1 MFS transporter [Actinocrinis puniceicyclus]
MSERILHKRQAVLGVIAVCIASAMLPISLTGSSVAMPAVAVDFHNSLAAGQWIVNGYDLTFASLMLASGALADLFGRRRMFVLGNLVFAIFSAASALSTEILTLDIARALAGVGAAVSLTAGSAILASLFEGAARARAFGIFGTAIGVGLAFGPFLAGALQTSLNWRAIFILPAIATALAAAMAFVLPESRDPGATRVDWAGTITFTGSLAALIWALLEGPQSGWAAPLNILAYVLAAGLMAGFVVAERVQQRPMFDLSLFRQARFVSLCVAVVALVFGFTPLLVYLPSYLTAVNNESTFRASVDLLMLTVPTLLFPVITGYLLRWVPMRHMVTLSVLLTAVGCGWLVVIAPAVGNWVVLGPFAVIGTGVGISFGVLDGAAVSSVESSRAGMAAGMFNTMRLSGESIAIAVVGSLLVSFTGAHLKGRLGAIGGPWANSPSALAAKLNQGQLRQPAAQVPADVREVFTRTAQSAYTGALHDVLWLLAALCAAATVLVAAVGRQRSPVGREEAAPLAAAPSDEPAAAAS